MAKAEWLRWSTCVVINGEKRLVAEGDGNGNVIRHMPDDEWKLLEERLMRRLGESMSRYAAHDPGSTL